MIKVFSRLKELIDVPSYSGQGGKVFAIKSAANGIEYVTQSTGGGGGGTTIVATLTADGNELRIGGLNLTNGKSIAFRAMISTGSFNNAAGVLISFNDYAPSAGTYVQYIGAYTSSGGASAWQNTAAAYYGSIGGLDASGRTLISGTIANVDGYPMGVGQNARHYSTGHLVCWSLTSIYQYSPITSITLKGVADLNFKTGSRFEITTL